LLHHAFLHAVASRGFTRDEKGEGRTFTHPLARPTGRAILPGPCSEVAAAWCGRGDHKQAPRFRATPLTNLPVRDRLGHDMMGATR
jgi:hypothetical protein